MPIYKKHIDEIKLELDSKAGRTRKEILKAYQIENFHKMSSNENALGPSPMAMDAVRECLDQLHEYSHRTDFELRQALEDFFNQKVSKEQFITTNSGLEMIELAIQGFAEVGDEVIISNPTFHVYEIFAEVAGAKVIDVPLDPETFEVVPEAILNAITEKTKLVFITNPNNPCGTAISKAQMDEIIYGLPDHVVAVIDEVYYHFHDLDQFPYAQDYIEEGKHVIGMHSFSKAYGLAGIRLAYGFSTPEISFYLQKLRRPFFINTMTMAAGLAALKDVDHISRTQEMVKEGRKYLCAAFDELALHYWPSHTNFILVRPKGEHMGLIEKMMQQGVALRAGDNNGADGCIRITIGEMEANRALVAALQQELEVSGQL